MQHSYRARYIAGSVALLRAKAAAAAHAHAHASADDGVKAAEGSATAAAAAAAAATPASALSADAWLLSLRSPDVPLERAVELLTELPGVGPKVASCVALFALDKHGAIPVDTHVWDLAKKYYAKDALRGKSAPVPALHPVVQRAFFDAFGPYAGWAHNALFVGELPAFQARIRRAAKEGAAALSSDGGEEDDGDEADGDFELRTPPAAGGGKPPPKMGKSESGGGGSTKRRPGVGAVEREERRRRRSGPRKEDGEGVPLPFESLLS